MSTGRRPALLFIATMLSGCVPLVAGGGIAATAVSMHDRRSTGAQADDEIAEWKAARRIPAEWRDKVHLNATAFNRELLITGEVPNDAARAAIDEALGGIEGLHRLHNELVVGPLSSFGSRSNDIVVSSRFRAQAVAAKDFSANHVKIVTENGTLFMLGLLNAREAAAAIALARQTQGVKRVVSLLNILPDADIQRIDRR